MSLYLIDQQILSLIDPETGEIMDWEAFDQLQMEREHKIENVALWYKNLTAEAAAIRQEELALAKRRQSLEQMAETRKKWLTEALCGQKFDTSKVSMTFRASTACEVSDPAALLRYLEDHSKESCIKYKEPEIVKSEVTKLLKAGEELPGAALAVRQNIQIK